MPFIRNKWQILWSVILWNSGISCSTNACLFLLEKVTNSSVFYGYSGYCLKNGTETSQNLRIYFSSKKITSLYCTYKPLPSVCSAHFLALSQQAGGSKSRNQSLVTILRICIKTH